MASLLNMVSVPPRISPTSHTRITSLQARPVLPAFSVSFSRRRQSIRATETDTNEGVCYEKQP
ncbi:hypothetical protein GYH30_044662 [Glycine max]|nr:hypothetical protein GYH30_044662 [Glycine max]